MATVPQAYELPYGFRLAAVQVAHPPLGTTGLAATTTDTGDLFTDNDHGLLDGERLIFETITTTTGISINTYYYVRDSTANTFKVATTAGGSAVAITGDGSVVYRALREYEIDFPNKITPSTETQTVNYQGGNKSVKRQVALGLGFTFDTDCIPIAAHRAIFDVTEVTSNLPDGYTSATPLLSEDTRSGVTVGFWGEADSQLYADDGDVSDGRDRYWYPNGTLSLVNPVGQTTGDKPGVMQYSFQANMDPQSDVLGMDLPSGLGGAPVIHMVKAI